MHTRIWWLHKGRKAAVQSSLLGVKKCLLQKAFTFGPQRTVSLFCETLDGSTKCWQQ